MKRLLFLSVAVLLLPLATATDVQAQCETIAGQSVRFFAANMTPVPTEQSGTTAEEPLFLGSGQKKPGESDPEVGALGCSVDDCRVCNTNNLKCKPVTGDCCCV